MEGMKKIVRKTTFFAVVLSVLIAALPPFFYFLLGYQYQSAVLETEAEMNGLLVTQIISASPEYWRYEHVKLEEFLSKNMIKNHDENRRILDSGGGVIAKSGNELKWPFITRSRNLYDFGNVVGRIEISHPLRPLLLDTLMVGLFSFVLGVSVYATLKMFPLRALSKTLQSLHIEKERVSKLNEELEMKVEERTRQLLDAQEELVLKEKLATLGQLSGSVGHELRNPMGVISNAIYFLQTVMPEADETVKEYLNIIKSEVINSERIISDLLDFTRTKTPQTEVITVNVLIKQSLGKCIVPQNISLRVEIPDTLPAVKVDPLQMGQVFYNLLTNAIQAMPNGGELRISARRGIRDQGPGVGEEKLIAGPRSRVPDQDFVEISVTDTGEGISPENIKKLFQPLFTTKARGIGLGLTVVKNLTEANGGMIVVESESGKGTTFTVTLLCDGKGGQ